MTRPGHNAMHLNAWDAVCNETLPSMVAQDNRVYTEISTVIANIRKTDGADAESESNSPSATYEAANDSAAHAFSAIQDGGNDYNISLDSALGAARVETFATNLVAGAESGDELTCINTDLFRDRVMESTDDLSADE